MIRFDRNMVFDKVDEMVEFRHVDAHTMTNRLLTDTTRSQAPWQVFDQ